MTEATPAAALLRARIRYDTAAMQFRIALFKEHRQSLLVEREPEKLLLRMADHVYPQEAVKKWMTQQE